ncbi:hypothetical protein, partial [Azotobacter beijerinckii]|uniref:hypothetical protein n=1 Tax=Azotobacter beijerinckii TaxID=170623 RepID=UPI002954C36A
AVAGSAKRRRLRGAAAVELHSDGATVNDRLGRQQVGFMDRFRLITLILIHPTKQKPPSRVRLGGLQ